MASVQLSDVSFGYGERTLFSKLTLELAEGKVTSIIGPNGCGKSSLLKLASGICKPWKGSISVMGRDVSALSSKERARLLSLLTQEHAAPPMSVRRLVACGRYPHHGILATIDAADYEAVERALEACRLADLAERPQPSFPAASGNAPSSPWSWRKTRPLCSSTSRPRFSTCPRATR